MVAVLRSEPSGCAGDAAAGAAHSPAGRTAWQRFLPDGPLAILPLCNGFDSLVWSTTPSHAAALCAAPEADFVAAVNDALTRAPQLPPPPPPIPGLAQLAAAVNFAASALQTLPTSSPSSLATFAPPPQYTHAPGKRLSFPLRFQQASVYSAHRLALIGDTAHALHPMAGQGLNLGLHDVAALLRTLDDAARSGGDVGSPVVLTAYTAAAHPTSLFMSLGVDAIGRVYAAQSPPLAALRGLGMAAVNALPPVKNFFTSVAMGLDRGGLASFLPRL